ncbi:Shg1p Ecym_2330 [Eremothecium cymbalariae DBVPG|uniref:BOD1/SHG1 domain-containing protein n=1 Tax=Eremothecium cymbalariae (strain CBS 270.75 / DBVPG 7215 / KCTC 17166 / NRRL Y-17582) TaxID=931890 RepID=G8JQ67_ERECY|nr:Hypothetical protein Ecym_2330 [Eremothecium cymbalariae DBVPG\
MSAKSEDPAITLAEAFKRKGYLDKLKQSILTDALYADGNTEENLETLVKKRVQELIKDMVHKDESLIFKNRGSTSALLEAQLFRTGYEMLKDDRVDVDKIIEDRLGDEELVSKIRSLLMEMHASKSE